MKKHLKTDLDTSQTTGDPAYFCKCRKWKLIGTRRTYVDNTRKSKTAEFQEQPKVTERIFESRPRKFDSFIFADIGKGKRQTDYSLQQTNYAF